MSDFSTDSILAEETAAKWHKHARANDRGSQSMMLPQTKTQTETSKPKASQSMMVCRENGNESEKISGAKLSKEQHISLSGLLPHISDPLISAKGLKIIAKAFEKERVGREAEKKFENKLSHTTKW